MRRAWAELFRFPGMRSRVQQPCNLWSLAEAPSSMKGMELRRDVLSDRSNGAEVQIFSGYHCVCPWRSISSAAVGGENRVSTELKGGLGPPTYFTSRNPFLEGSVRFKSQKKKNKKKSKNKTKASKEDRLRLRSLQRERKLRKLRMTPEEALLYRMQKAQRKIALQQQYLKKYALPERPEKPDDPEVMTPEQLHALKKLGYKNKNYVPVGRRGIYGGVIQNMHLHWKKHETVRVDCDNYKRDEVQAMAIELEKLSGGKVIDIHQGTTIIMYRGKNYKQPKKLIPDNMLDKRKALLKSLHDQSLKSLQDYVVKLEGELKVLRAQMAAEAAMAPPQPSTEEVDDFQRTADSWPVYAQLQDEDIFTEDISDRSDLEADSDIEDLLPSSGCVWETDASSSQSSGSEDDEDHNIFVADLATADCEREASCRPDHTVLEAQEVCSLADGEREAYDGGDNLDDRCDDVNLGRVGSRDPSSEEMISERVHVG